LDAVQSALDALRQGPKDFSSWYQRILAFLATIHGDVEFDMDDPSQRAELAVFQRLVKSLEALSLVPVELASDNLTAAEVIRIALQSLRSESIPAPVDDDAINLLGWLELTLDDAPVAIVTSLNEGVVPKSVNSDMFLPDALRSRLGLDDNARRYARDAYALSVLLASRPRSTLIVGRRSSQGDPMLPSRLVLADDPLTVTRRSLRLFGELDQACLAPAVENEMDLRSAAPRGFEIPRPKPLDRPIDRLSTTAFKDYLACPYRFYLRHVLKLEQRSDDGTEMDARQFGSLLHEVLRLFGGSPARESSDPAEIEEYLVGTLYQLAAHQFVKGTLASVRVQIEQLRLRLVAFSQVQARQRQDGWRIHHVESRSEQIEVDFPVDGQPFLLVGRIDRIDVHETTETARVLDYKTGDTVKSPDETHRGQGDADWSDLQLPLYRHLAARLGLHAGELGYLSIPKDRAKVGFNKAEWSEARLEQADDVARDVIRKLRREEFWPPSKEIMPRMDDFAGICQSRIPRIG
jgi:hypothetical protein